MAARERKDHPVLSNAWEYRVIELHMKTESDSVRLDHLDLFLEKNGSIKRLRFMHPRNLKIERGFPSPTFGMAILDIAARGLEDLNVEVADFESSEGGITFYAKEVIDLDAG